MENAPVIIKARITGMPKSFWDPMPSVMVKMSNDPEHEKKLFEFYPDEIMFSSTEFIGLTEDEARHLFFKKDKDFLQS